MKHTAFIILLFCSILACKPSTSTSEKTEDAPADTTATITMEIPGLKRMWDTEATLTTAESVLYDKSENLLYVSCINGVPPNKKDKDGFIAKVGMDGKVITLKWATGFSAPKGMGMADQTLYVTDIDRLVAVDMTTGKIKETWEIKEASFLNDVFVSTNGNVYFTDSDKSTIYGLVENKIVEIYKDKALGGTNGVFEEGNVLYLTTFESGKVYTLDLMSKAVQQVAEGVPGGDGIERYNDGWLASNWNGEVYHISATGEVTELLDTQEAKLNAADIEVVADQNLLLVPTFFGNSVTAYSLSKN